MLSPHLPLPSVCVFVAPSLPTALVSPPPRALARPCRATPAQVADQWLSPKSAAKRRFSTIEADTAKRRANIIAHQNRGWAAFPSFEEGPLNKLTSAPETADSGAQSDSKPKSAKQQEADRCAPARTRPPGAHRRIVPRPAALAGTFSHAPLVARPGTTLAPTLAALVTPLARSSAG